MQLEHTFTVPVDVDEAWKVLLDIEQVASCMPGAALHTVHGDNFTGTVKVKVGPIGLTYNGEASFIEKDEAAHRAVIDARGKDSRGAGTAAAKVAATLHSEGEGTRVDVVTDLNITGKPAQFGRGVMVDVGNKLIGQFADCLAGKLTAGGPAAAPEVPGPKAAAPEAAEAAVASGAATAAPQAAAPEVPAAAPEVAEPAQPRRVYPPSEPEPINLVSSAGPAILKRLAPVVAVALVLIVVWRFRARRRG